MAFEVSQYQLVTLYEIPLEWIGWTSLLFLTLMPILSILIWKMKERVQYRKLDWDFRHREVTYTEFSKMVKEYNRNYRQIIAFLDLKILPLTLACYLGALFLPFALMRSVIILISVTPIIVAILLVLFGLLFSYLIFEFIPNSVTPEFPTYRPRIFQEPVRFLAHVPGIYWSGVRLTIGEAGGFYTLRNPYPVARIEGIEGVIRVDCILDDTGSISNVITLFDSEDSQDSTPIGKVESPVTTVNVVQLIRKTLETYIASRGGDDLLEDVLEEIDAYLCKHSCLNVQKKSNDGLISSNDKGPAKEERT
jgi:hypothetical protein